MIVAAYLSHERKKWARGNEDREPIANDDERRPHAETREQ